MIYTVYRYWRGEELLYVGVTKRPFDRIDEHRRKRPWWESVERATFEHFPNRALAYAAEEAAIKNEHPTHNVQHNHIHFKRVNPEGALMTPQDLYEYWGMSKTGLSEMRRRGTGPAYIKVAPKIVRYERGTVNKWLEGLLAADMDGWKSTSDQVAA